MPKKQKILGDLNDPKSLAFQMRNYLERLRIKGFSESSIESLEHYLGLFSRFCLERGLYKPLDVTAKILERYQGVVSRATRIRDGQPLSRLERSQRLTCVRLFFGWLVKTGLIPANPASGIELPRQVLSQEEIERVMSSVDLSTPAGLRDRAIMEVLYATGIRRSELCNLKLSHLSFDKGVLLVERGKNKKDRVVPLGERAVYWLARYLNEDRSFIPGSKQSEWLFITISSGPIHPPHLTAKLQKRIQRSGIEKSSCCHIFRHTMATLMLEGGADIRYIQEMLGHARLRTTQIYTKVSIGKLKEIHEQTHPGAFLRRKGA